MKKLYVGFLIVSVSVIGVFSTASAAMISVTTADLNGADAYVQSSLSGNNAANQNYGSSESVIIKHDTALPGNNRKGYLRFDIGWFSADIYGAELLLTYAGTNADPGANPSTYSVFGLVDGHSGENWGENTITWNNAPGNNTASAGGVLGGETTFLGTFSLALASATAGDVISFSSPALLSFLLADTDGLATILLTRDQQNFSVELFASKENTSWAAPTLNLNLDPIPIPAAFWLFGTALLGLIGISRRKKIA